MARSKISLWKGISGRLGPIVAYVSNDKQYFKLYTVPRDPKTPAQLAQRAKLKLVNKGLSPLNKTIKHGYRDESRTYRSLVGKTIREYVTGEYPNLSIDYSKIEIADGKLHLPAYVTATFDPDTRQVRFSWDTQQATATEWCRADDIAHIVLLHTPTLVVIRSPGNVIRSDGTASVDLRAGWLPADHHCWIYFSSLILEENSKSLYVTIGQDG